MLELIGLLDVAHTINFPSSDCPAIFPIHRNLPLLLPGLHGEIYFLHLQSQLFVLAGDL